MTSPQELHRYLRISSYGLIQETSWCVQLFKVHLRINSRQVIYFNAHIGFYHIFKDGIMQAKNEH